MRCSHLQHVSVRLAICQHVVDGACCSGLGPMQGQANHFTRYAPEKVERLGVRQSLSCLGYRKAIRHAVNDTQLTATTGALRH